MKIWAPISTRDRDRAFATMVKRGYASHKEMLDSVFGEDITQLKGVEITEPPQGVIHFRPISEDPEQNPIDRLVSLAYVRDQQPDTIYINRELMSPIGQLGGAVASRMFLARLHEAIDIVAGAELRQIGIAFVVGGFLTTFRFAMFTSLTKMFGMSLADEISQEQVHILDLTDPNASTKINSYQAIAKDIVLTRGETQRALITLKRGADMLFTLMPLSSWTLDREMEARLHLINLRYYKVWGALPSNREELAAALAGVGVISPKIVRKWLNHRDQRVLRQRYQTHGMLDFNGLLCPPVAELNIGLNAAHDAGVLQMYWEDGLPLMYARLLNKYGDRGAMARFGFSADPQATDLAGLPMLLPSPERPEIVGANIEPSLLRPTQS